MIKKRNKIMILFVALMMFTFTWAGVFADTVPQEGTGEDNQQATEENNENLDGGALNNEAGETENAEEPAVTDETKDETAAKADGDAQGVVLTVNASENADKTIKVVWNKVDGATKYEVTESVNGGVAKAVTEEPVESETGFTLTTAKKDAGEYKYTVIATVGEKTVSGTSLVTIKPATPDAVKNIKGLSGCDCVVITFDKGNAEGFIIYRYKSKADFDNNTNDDKWITPVNGKDYITYSGSSNNIVSWTNALGVSKKETYWFKVYAANRINKEKGWENSNVVKSSAAVIEDKGCVRPMYITLKLKKKRTLKSLNGGPRITLKKNTTITANGFGGGCYYFTYNDKKYRMARSSAKKQKALYNGRYGYNYTPEEAELFVKQAGLKSKTNYLIWVSFYTQRLYLFQKNGEDWKCIRDWDCATGKASTPSPTGDKAIGKKKKSHHNIRWWSSFSNPKSIANSIHGKKKGWKLGLPQSHGCIRNEVANAKYIYDKCPKNTKVYNY